MTGKLPPERLAPKIFPPGLRLGVDLGLGLVAIFLVPP